MATPPILSCKCKYTLKEEDKNCMLFILFKFGKENTGVGRSLHGREEELELGAVERNKKDWGYKYD